MRFLDIQIVNDLINVIDQETKAYEDILKISKRKTSIIIEGKVSELENIIKLEQALVFQMGRLETAREKLVDKLAEQLSIKSEETTISEIIKHVKSGEADKLKASHNNITGVLNELKSSNEINSKLIKNSLDFINFSINLISGVDNGTNNYGNTGQARDSKKRNFFDMKL